MKKPHYTDEQIEYVRSIAKGRPRKEITRLFNEKFNQNRTVRSIGDLMHRRGIKNNMQGYATRFKKGQKAWNKGMKGLDLGGQEGWFKKGEESPTRQPVGTERTLQGWVEIKTANPSTWVKKHRYIWEQAHGPIPEGNVILFKDGDKMNITLDNLFMVPQTAMTSVALRKMRSEHPEVNEAVHRLAELELTIREKERSQ